MGSQHVKHQQSSALLSSNRCLGSRNLTMLNGGCLRFCVRTLLVEKWHSRPENRSFSQDEMQRTSMKSYHGIARLCKCGRSGATRTIVKTTHSHVLVTDEAWSTTMTHCFTSRKAGPWQGRLTNYRSACAFCLCTLSRQINQPRFKGSSIQAVFWRELSDRVISLAGSVHHKVIRRCFYPNMRPVWALLGQAQREDHLYFNWSPTKAKSVPRLGFEQEQEAVEHLEGSCNL